MVYDVREKIIYSSRKVTMLRNLPFFVHQSYVCQCVGFFFGGGGAQQPPVGQGLLIHEVSKSHTTTHRNW